uniref:NADH-ubiquinone oxidoreductase chain 3 n=1 Tax=Amblyomma triguttatum TaxID=65637 RepID=Q6I7M6_9ACAR|nr:NADH dehydrogenase subunit 3 [Amblyomma triguttatum]BAD24957.1 NADH dehydrogenease subunit 3 [Amblyomma triguttatum]
MFVFLVVILMILTLIFLIFKFLEFHNYLSKEKLSPFECGFDPFTLSRVPFSLKFFFIGIVFLVFDIEIVIVTPFPLLLKSKNLIFVLFFILINFIIILGLLMEWKKGMIEWIK